MSDKLYNFSFYQIEGKNPYLTILFWEWSSMGYLVPEPLYLFNKYEYLLWNFILGTISPSICIFPNNNLSSYYMLTK